MIIKTCIDKHDNSIVYQIKDIDSRKAVVEQLLSRKYVVSWNKKGKLNLNMRNC